MAASEVRGSSGNQSSAAVAWPSVTNLGTAVYHDGAKQEWKLAIRPTTSVVWIGDSNSKRIKNVPIDWEVHSFQGARFPHVTELFRQLINRPALNTVIIAAGINHRDDGDDRCVGHLRELNSVVSFFDSVGIKTTIIGVSYPTTLKQSARAQVDRINQWLQSELPTAHYIAPLKSGEVTVIDDRYGIHYDADTVECIFRTAVAMYTDAASSSQRPQDNTIIAADSMGLQGYQGNQTLTNTLTIDTSVSMETEQADFEVVAKSNKRKVGDRTPPPDVDKRPRTNGGSEPHSPQTAQGKQSLVLYLKGIGFSISKMLREQPIVFRNVFESAYGSVDGEVRLCRSDCIQIKCKSVQQRDRILNERSLDGRAVDAGYRSEAWTANRPQTVTKRGHWPRRAAIYAVH